MCQVLSMFELLSLKEYNLKKKNNLNLISKVKIHLKPIN